MTGRVGRLAEAEAARRLAAGEPFVRNRRRQSLSRGWSFVCPFPNTPECGAGSMHEGFADADACRAAWIEHATTRHPGQPISWPADTPGVEPGQELGQLSLFHLEAA